MRNQLPEGLQRVDEDILLLQVMELTPETETKLFSYERIGCYGNYFQTPLRRSAKLEPAAARRRRPWTLPAAKTVVNEVLGWAAPAALAGRQDYVRVYLIRLTPEDPAGKFWIYWAERRRILDVWLRRREGQ